MKKIAILYHANCPDGFGGAWAAWEKFGNKAEYVPVRYNIPPPELKGKSLFMVDFCYNEAEFFEKLKENNEKLVIIDHHITCKENLKFADEFVFEMGNSGAVLAWQYFHPDKKVPLFLKYIEDMDLWKFKMKGTEEIAAALDMVPQDFKKWDEFIKNFEKEKFRKEWIGKGKLILDFSNALIRKTIDKSGELVDFQGYKIYAVNTPLFESEMGSVLYKKQPPMSIMWFTGKDGVKVSLRSNGSVDVSKIAEKFGGGGHKGAAGFRLPKGAELPWKAIE